MPVEKYDYLIVGQGLAGTFLSRELLRRGQSVLVVDESKPFTASRVASGVINPVTGRRIVRTWEIETLMPFAVSSYQDLEALLGVSLIRQCNILDFHPTPQMVLAFEERMPAEKEYLRHPDDPEQWRSYFNFPFSIGEIDPCWLVDVHALLNSWRQYLAENKYLRENRVEISDCTVLEDHVTWKNIRAKKIIFCDGVAGFSNPYFGRLPYAHNKGQAVIVSIPGLPRTNIFKQGLNIVPWKEDLFWVGSSYEWDYTDIEPSPAFLEKVTGQLSAWLKLPFTVVDHIASERPANMERRPFAGLHPVADVVGILNGFGTKGCSLAPYFADQLATYLVTGKPVMPQVDVRRFTKVLSAAKP